MSPVMDDHFEKNALSWGEGGAAWLKSIPKVIKKYESRWSIKVLPPYTLSFNYVAPVQRADGSMAVLKMIYPGDLEFKSEIKALEYFKGNGIVKLLEVDEKDAIILLEHIAPGKPLSSLDNDDQATKIIAKVIKKLQEKSSTANNFVSINDWVSEIPKYKQGFLGEQAPLPTLLVNKAEILFKQLIATSAKPILVHGDLHHDNILQSNKSGWLAIDPKGVSAEPAYEVAAMIRNPYEKLKDIPDLAPLLRRRITILSEELEIDPQRILDWCFAQTMLSAVWSVGGVKGPEHALRVAETLDTLAL